MTRMTRGNINHYWKATAYVILALAAGVAIDRSAKTTAHESARILYNSQIAACERGNLLRAEINRRVRSNLVERDALIDFLDTAEVARRASYAKTHQVSDLKAAEGYARLIREVRQKVHFNKVTIVRCNHAIARP